MTLLAGGTLELQDPDNDVFFEFLEGGLDGEMVYRGDDWTIPAKVGIDYMPKVADHWPVRLKGWVAGAPGAGAGESYLSRFSAVAALFNPGHDPFDIVADENAEGIGGRLGAGEIATITVVAIRIVGPPAFADRWRDLEIECRSISGAAGPGWSFGSP